MQTNKQIDIVQANPERPQDLLSPNTQRLRAEESDGSGIMPSYPSRKVYGSMQAAR